ncbi:Protoheme IX farnesyltransferase [Frankliniella fusca]|uniref:Protoheme IX farnesyltransferase n=1 Tax=Frankliniella fusca TaxID=407009 RepID=A0AAE1LDS5_9NEOP|nr:Protoheme IX farnesyltransferase [Frankliniella fusca]
MHQDLVSHFLSLRLFSLLSRTEVHFEELLKNRRENSARDQVLQTDLCYTICTLGYALEGSCDVPIMRLALATLEKWYESTLDAGSMLAYV